MPNKSVTIPLSERKQDLASCSAKGGDQKIHSMSGTTTSRSASTNTSTASALTLRSLRSLRALPSHLKQKRQRAERAANQPPAISSSSSDPASSTSTYRGIKLNNVPGILTLTAESIRFQPGEQQRIEKVSEKKNEKEISWSWEALQKHMICVAPDKAGKRSLGLSDEACHQEGDNFLLKLVVLQRQSPPNQNTIKNSLTSVVTATTNSASGYSKVLIIKYPNRTALEGIHADMTHRLEQYRQQPLRQKYQKVKESLLLSQRRLKDSNKAVDELQDVNQTLLDTCEALARKGQALKAELQSSHGRYRQLLQETMQRYKHQQQQQQQHPDRQILDLQVQLKDLQRYVEAFKNEKTAREIEHEMDVQEYKERAETLEQQLREEQTLTEQLLEERQALDDLLVLQRGQTAPSTPREEASSPSKGRTEQSSMMPSLWSSQETPISYQVLQAKLQALSTHEQHQEELDMNSSSDSSDDEHIDSLDAQHQQFNGNGQGKHVRQMTKEKWITASNEPFLPEEQTWNNHHSKGGDFDNSPFRIHHKTTINGTANGGAGQNTPIASILNMMQRPFTAASSSVDAILLGLPSIEEVPLDVNCSFDKSDSEQNQNGSESIVVQNWAALQTSSSSSSRDLTLPHSTEMKIKQHLDAMLDVSDDQQEKGVAYEKSVEVAANDEERDCQATRDYKPNSPSLPSVSPPSKVKLCNSFLGTSSIVHGIDNDSIPHILSESEALDMLLDCE